MILLECPNCGPRNAQEFRYGGEVRPRPDLNAVTPEEWSDYVYMRENPLGLMREWWYHHAGCGLWFIVARHTKTHDVVTIHAWTGDAS